MQFGENMHEIFKDHQKEQEFVLYLNFRRYSHQLKTLVFVRGVCLPIYNIKVTRQTHHPKTSLPEGRVRLKILTEKNINHKNRTVKQFELHIFIYSKFKKGFTCQLYITTKKYVSTLNIRVQLIKYVEQSGMSSY